MTLCAAKAFWETKGLKDGQQEVLKAEILEELARVEQKERISRIIYETYIKEIERLKQKLAQKEQPQEPALSTERTAPIKRCKTVRVNHSKQAP